MPGTRRRAPTRDPTTPPLTPPPPNLPTPGPPGPGTIGGVFATPMLNPPEAAILGLGRARALPRYDASGALVRRHVLGFSWGADHRVVDGAAVAAFSNTFKRLVERPAALLAHLR